MIVETFQPYHIELLRAQGVQDCQQRALSHVPASSASVMRPVGPALTMREGGKIVACGGILTAGPKLGVLWALLSQDAGRHMLQLHRATMRFIGTVPLRRLEATVEENFPAGCRWLELMGFAFEGKMAAYGEDGETHLRYARVSF